MGSGSMLPTKGTAKAVPFSFAVFDAVVSRYRPPEARAAGIFFERGRVAWA